MYHKKCKVSHSVQPQPLEMYDLQHCFIFRASAGIWVYKKTEEVRLRKTTASSMLLLLSVQMNILTQLKGTNKMPSCLAWGQNKKVRHLTHQQPST